MTEFSDDEQNAVEQVLAAVRELRRVLAFAETVDISLRLQYAKYQRPNWVTIGGDKLDTPIHVGAEGKWVEE